MKTDHFPALEVRVFFVEIEFSNDFLVHFMSSFLVKFTNILLAFEAHVAIYFRVVTPGFALVQTAIKYLMNPGIVIIN